MRAKDARRLLRERDRLRERHAEAERRLADARARALELDGLRLEADHAQVRAQDDVSSLEDALSSARRNLRRVDEVHARVVHEAFQALADSQEADRCVSSLASTISDPRFAEAEAEARLAVVAARRAEDGKRIRIMSPEEVAGREWLARVFSARPRGTNCPVEAEVIEREIEAGEAEGVDG